MIKEYINKVICGDSLEILKKLPDKSIDLVLTDPPYFGIVRNDWDNQWETGQEFINWLEEYTKEWKRILKDNGSLYIFGDDKLIAYIQVMMDKYFKLENSIVWNKGKRYLTSKGWNCIRSYSVVTERLLFYSNGHNKTGGEIIFEEYLKPKNPFSIYLKSEFKNANINNREIAKLFRSATGGLTGCVSNWLNGDDNITEEKYLKIRKYLKNKFLKKPYKELRKEYEELRKEYEELRKQYEELRRPFKPSENFTDVWNFGSTEPKEKWAGNHPTIKPLLLFKRIIETSSREGDIILDCFGGSGTTAVACIETNRKYIVIEKDSKYCEIAEKRIRNTTPPLFTIDF